MRQNRFRLTPAPLDHFRKDCGDCLDLDQTLPSTPHLLTKVQLN